MCAVLNVIFRLQYTAADAVPCNAEKTMLHRGSASKASASDSITLGVPPDEYPVE